MFINHTPVKSVEFNICLFQHLQLTFGTADKRFVFLDNGLVILYKNIYSNICIFKHKMFVQLYQGNLILKD